jgi:hypothetical protein
VLRANGHPVGQASGMDCIWQHSDWKWATGCMLCLRVVIKRDASVMLVTLGIVDNISLLLKCVLEAIFSIAKQVIFLTNTAMV